MNQSTEMTGLGALDKFSRLLHSRSYGMLCFFYGAGGFMMAMSQIIGGQAPFGVALLAAVPFRFTLPSTLGVALGYLVGGGMSEGYPFVGAALLLTMTRWVLGQKRWEGQRVWLAPAAASGLVFLTGVLPFIYSDPLIYDIVLWSTRVVMAGASTVFLDRAMGLLDKGGTCRNRMDYMSLVLLAALLLMGMDAVSFNSVSLGRVAATVVVLFAALAGDERAATMAGVICGVIIGFSTGDFTLYVAAYSLGGLLAGIFSAFGRGGSTLAYSVTWGGISMLADGGVWGLFSVGIGAVVFLMIPRSALRMGTRILKSPVTDERTVRAVVEDRLYRVGQSLQDVSQTTRDVARRLTDLSAGEASLPDRVAQNVCRRCSMSTSCWVDQYSDTVDAMEKTLAKLRRGEAVGATSFPDSFGRCIQKERVAQGLEDEFHLWNSRQDTRQQAERMRGVVTDQFEGLALTLEGVAEEIRDITSGDQVLAGRIEEIFYDAKLEPQEVICWRGRDERLVCSVVIPRYKSTRLNPQDILPRLEEVGEVRFSYPALQDSGDGRCRYVFYEQPVFAAEYGSSQIACRGNKLCGDTFRLVHTQGGTAHIILSDGMGSGSAAAVDSAMASSLLARMLEEGVNYSGALKLMNAALLVKSGEESLATLDAVQVDLYTGRARFYKAGAAPTVILKDGRGIIMDTTSLPAGILSGVEFEESGLTLGEGDMILMLSDGAVTEGCQWIASLLEKGRGEDLDELCRRIANSARLRRTDGREDDITVVGFRMTRNE